MAKEDGEQVVEAVERVVNAVRRFHTSIIEESGGALGEDAAKLYSAISRPFQTWDGVPLFPTAIAKAAAVFHGIICGHAFTDGCKRTGTITAAVFLEIWGHIPDPATPEQIRRMEPLALEAASPGGVTIDHIVAELSEIFGKNPTGSADG